MNTPLKMRQRKTVDPCQRCFLHKSRCICALIPQIETRTRLTLVIHSRELKRTTNTGRLAHFALPNSELIVRGRPDEPLDFTQILMPTHQPLLLFPADNALPISEVRMDDRPVQLIVSDGNWRQASKLNTRHQELNDIPRVIIKPPPRLDGLHLRKEHFPEGLSTIEAIAYAFGEIESRSIQDRLLELYEAKLKATLTGRGQGT